MVFHEVFGEGDRATRRAEDLALPLRSLQPNPRRPLVALQHNPLHPPIADPYPYLLENAAAVRQTYREAGVILSLSGHYHAGQRAHAVDGTLYHTVAAACQRPFRFSHVRLRGRTAQVNEYALSMEPVGLFDAHCHTQFAYCGTTISAPRNIEIAREMGLGGLGVVEHTFQLYFDKEEAWSFEWFDHPARVREVWQQGRGRMPEYRRFVESLRRTVAEERAGFSVRFGLEVDFCADGTLLLAEEDRSGWDYLIGSIHKVDGYRRGATTLARAEEQFLDQTRKLLSHPIHILAHPFRWFQGEKLPVPVHLYGTVAGELAERGIAAEINFHNFATDPRFIEECLARGVRIALGTDSHAMEEVGELHPHLECLRRAGVDDDRLAKVLFRPPASGARA